MPTDVLKLPLIAADQAQKHVTANEATEALDDIISTWQQSRWTTGTIASDVLTPLSSSVQVRTEGAASSDGITSIVVPTQPYDTGSPASKIDGAEITLKGFDGETVTITAGSTIKLGAATRVLSNEYDTLRLKYHETDDVWIEIGFTTIS
jgi:hypothetical protein